MTKLKPITKITPSKHTIRDSEKAKIILNSLITQLYTVPTKTKYG